jgi:hypothetical protein
MIPHCTGTGQALGTMSVEPVRAGRRGYEAGGAGDLVIYSGCLKLTLAWRVKGNEEKAPHDDHYGVSIVY